MKCNTQLTETFISHYGLLRFRTKIEKKRRYKSNKVEICKDKSSISEKIRYARSEAELTEKELAVLCNVSRSTIIRYENGQVSESRMKPELLCRIALACKRDKLFCCNEYYRFISGNFAQSLKKYRVDNKLTVREMADMFYVTIKTVRFWERGIYHPPFVVWEKIRNRNE